MLVALPVDLHRALYYETNYLFHFVLKWVASNRTLVRLRRRGGLGAIVDNVAMPSLELCDDSWLDIVKTFQF